MNCVVLDMSEMLPVIFVVTCRRSIMKTAIVDTNALVVMSQPQMLEKLQHSEVTSDTHSNRVKLFEFISWAENKRLKINCIIKIRHLISFITATLI